MHSFPSHIWGEYLVYITYICNAYKLEALIPMCLIKVILNCFKDKNIQI